MSLATGSVAAPMKTALDDRLMHYCAETTRGGSNWVFPELDSGYADAKAGRISKAPTKSYKSGVNAASSRKSRQRSYADDLARMGPRERLGMGRRHAG